MFGLLKVGLIGFGKSFLAWNLAGAVEDSVIYADSHAPYRVWNRTVRVEESWAQVEKSAPQLVVIDHAEAEVLPDQILMLVPPDPLRIEEALRMKKEQQGRRQLHLVLNGYEEGAPWLFPETFHPVAVLPWDVRQLSACVLRIPLVQRDPKFRHYLNPILEVLFGVDAR